jgi:ferredoxin
MMTAVRSILVGMGVPDAEVLQEAFVSRPLVEPAGQGGVALAAEAVLDGAAASVRFTRSGKATELADQTVLEAAEAIGVDIPFECRSGICGQCKTRLVAGQVTMDVQDALTAADRSKGLILACQAHATRDVEIYA